MQHNKLVFIALNMQENSSYMLFVEKCISHVQLSQKEQPLIFLQIDFELNIFVNTTVLNVLPFDL